METDCGSTSKSCSRIFCTVDKTSLFICVRAKHNCRRGPR
jgi:hypothetical protein